jgi:hypothetical protein
MRIYFEAAPIGIVHQDQRGAIIGHEIAGADVLSVAAKVGNRKRPVIENADEAGPPAAEYETAPAPVSLLGRSQGLTPLKVRMALDFVAPRLRARLA